MKKILVLIFLLACLPSAFAANATLAGTNNFFNINTWSNSGCTYTMDSLGRFAMTNSSNGSYWLMGTNGHYKGVDQYGNLREWTTNRFTVQISVGGVSKALVFSNGILSVDNFSGNGGGLSNLPAVTYQTFIETNYVEDTNNIYITLAGTASSNGHYGFKQSAFTSGWIYTNFAGGAFICKDLGGNNGGTLDGTQNPFYIGSTTNNNQTAWYYSPIDERYNWLNSSTAIGDYAGTLPNPVFHYGTNTVLITNTVLVQTAIITAARNLKMVIVDITNGCDTGALTGVCPFKTLTAAKNYATNGWVVYVQPGVYNENNLLKNGVDWYFQPGTTCGFTDYQYRTNAIGIFDDRSGAITSNVTGDKLYYYSQAAYPASVCAITNPASRVTIKFISDTLGYSASVPLTSQANNLNPLSDFATVWNCSYTSFNSLHSDTAIPSGATKIDAGGNNLTYGQLISAASSPMGCYWRQGEEHINRTYFDGTGCYQGFLWCDNSHGNAVPAETSIFYNSDFTGGHFYDSTTNATCKVWLNITYLHGDSSALTLLGSSFIYLTSQKTSSGGPVVECAGSNNKLWASIQKSSTSTTLLDLIGNQTANLQLGELEYTGTGLTGPLMIINSGTNFITAQSSILFTNGNTLKVVGGITELNDLRSDSSASASFANILMTGGNLTLKNVNLISAGTQFCISNTIATNVVMSSVTLTTRPSANTVVVGNYSAGGTNYSSAGFAGNGINLTNLSASNLSGGTLSDARLSANVPLLNAVNAFTANQSINGALILTNSPAASASDTNIAATDSTGKQIKLSINALPSGGGSGNVTNVTADTLISSNLVIGTFYTNNYGTMIQVQHLTAVPTVALVAGNVSVSLEISGVSTNPVWSAPTAIGVGIAGAETNSLPTFIVPTNAIFRLVDTSTGAGNSVAMAPGAQILERGNMTTTSGLTVAAVTNLFPLVNTNITMLGVTVVTNSSQSSIGSLTLYVTNATPHSFSVYFSYGAGTVSLLTNLFHVNYNCTLPYAANPVFCSVGPNEITASTSFKWAISSTPAPTSTGFDFFINFGTATATGYQWNFIVYP